VARDAVVLTGGDPASPALADHVPADAYVIAADSGSRRAPPWGSTSTSSSATSTRSSPGCSGPPRSRRPVERHPVAKDRTDLAIALDAARRHAPDGRITVIGGHGGRLDHLLANALVLASDEYADLRRRALHRQRDRHVVRRSRSSSRAYAASTCQLLPVHGPAHGVTTDGTALPPARRGPPGRRPPGASATSSSRAVRHRPAPRGRAARGAAGRRSAPTCARASSRRRTDCDAHAGHPRLVQRLRGHARRLHRQTGIEVERRPVGRRRHDVNQAILTKDDPQGDVLFGVDNTFLSRALDEDLFVALRVRRRSTRSTTSVLDDPSTGSPRSTSATCASTTTSPGSRSRASPSRRRSPTSPTPTTPACCGREPGHLLARARVPARHRRAFGEDGYLDFWADLRDNDVLVTDGWEEAYYGEFSGGAGRGRPAAGGLLRLEPARRGDLRRGAARRGADRRDRGVVLPADRVRRHPRRHRARGGPAADRLHAVGPLPGGHPADDVRLPGQRGRRAARGVRRARRPRRPAAARPERSGRTATRGSRTGPPRSCGDHRAGGADDAAGRRGLQLALLAVPARSSRSSSRWPVGDRADRPAPDGLGPDLGAVRGAGRPGVRGVVWFTLWQAVVSTAADPAVGLPGAYAIARLRFPGRALCGRRSPVPFVLPTVVVGGGVPGLLGPRARSTPLLGAAVRRGRPDARPAPHRHRHPARARVLQLRGGRAHRRRAVVAPRPAARGRRPRARREPVADLPGGVLPLLRPAIASAAAIVFLFTFTSFGVVLILGGPGLATIEVEIHRAHASCSTCRSPRCWRCCSWSRWWPRWPSTAGCSDVDAAAAARAPRGRPAPGRRGSGGSWANLAPSCWCCWRCRCWCSSSGRCRPPRATGSATTGRAVRPAARTVLFVPPWEAVRNSVLFALAATVVALVVGGLSAPPRWSARGAAAGCRPG
jgi:hypothetical protein